MKSRKWRVSADLPNPTRALLLRTYPPRLDQVHLRAITWAYGVEQDFQFNTDNQECVLTGLHRTGQHEAFTVQLDGESFRPDGSRLFLALSTAAGLPPVAAGQIVSDDVEWFDEPIHLHVALKLYPPGNNQARTWASA